MAMAAVSISPVGEGISVSRYVAAALRVARADPRVKVRLGPMFTTLEGELSDVLDVARRMHEAVFEAGAVRVGMVIKVDDRRDRKADMDEKVHAVEALLGDNGLGDGG